MDETQWAGRGGKYLFEMDIDVSRSKVHTINRENLDEPDHDAQNDLPRERAKAIMTKNTYQ